MDRNLQLKLNIKNANFHMPSGSYKPENLWWEVMKVGNYFPSESPKEMQNKDGSVDFTAEMLDQFVKNTKNLLSKGEPIRIKHGHNDNVPVIGLAKDINIDDNGVVKILVYSLDPDVANAISKGNYPSLSVEVSEVKPFGSVIHSIALLGSELPAVNGLKTPDIMYASNESSKPVFRLENKLMEVNSMNDNAVKTQEPVITEPQAETEKELLALKAEIEATKKALKTESALKTEINELRAKLESESKERKLEKIKFELSNKRLPGIDKEALAEFMSNLDDKTELKLSANVDKITGYNFIKQLVDVYDKVMASLGEPIVNLESKENNKDGTVKSGVKLTYGKDNEKIAARVKQFMIENKITDITVATDMLVQAGEIVEPMGWEEMYG